MRASGILLHISSLPSPHGIGTMGAAAKDFVDFLVKAGQAYWQILPVCPTSYGDSPYQSFSTFAGNPYFIDLDLLAKAGLLQPEEYESIDWESTPGCVNYGALYQKRYAVLHKACARLLAAPPADYADFLAKNAFWLPDYALFMALKDAHDGKPWYQWEKPLAMRDPKALEKAKETYAEQISFYTVLQFWFYQQWGQLKAYCNQNGISIVGDIPIYVAYDSVDVWVDPELFLLDKTRTPIDVAGCPPDVFSPTGQLWGNPLYDWDYHKKTHYDWWMRRIKGQLNMVDYIRVDHFRGFEQYYAIPYGEETAMHGKWKKGPNEDLFLRMQEVFGKDLPIWAEDLGIITPRVEKLRDDFNLPGMKVLQFAFGDPKDNDILPHRFTTENCICYTGTHDNDTTMGWYQTLKPALQDRVRRYLNTDGNIIHYDMIRAAMGSIARYAIYPVQDLLGFGSDCRMNTPSVAGGNWAFRFRKDHLTPELAANLRKMTELFGRCEPLEPIEEEEGPEGSIKPGETAPGLAPEE